MPECAWRRWPVTSSSTATWPETFLEKKALASTITGCSHVLRYFGTCALPSVQLCMQVTVAYVLRVALLGITSVSRRCGCPACTRAALPALAGAMLNRQQEQLKDARAANGMLNGKGEQLNNTKRQQHDQLGHHLTRLTAGGVKDVPSGA